MEINELPMLSSSLRSSKGKGVRFRSSLAREYVENNLFRASQMNDEEKSKIWWQESDYYMFKKTSKMIASEMRRRQSIEQANSRSYASIMERTYCICCQTESNDACPLSSRDKYYLERWEEHGVSRRGLERWSFPKLAKERQRRKEVAIRGVIEVQNRFIRGMNLDFDTGAEFIRKSSEQLTRYVAAHSLLVYFLDMI